MFYGITDLTAFVMGTVLIVLLPGPNSLFVMSVASQRGISTGYRAAMGVFTGDTILMLLAASGMASVLHSAPEIFSVLKYAGAAYLAYLGWQLLKGAWAAWQRPQFEAPPLPKQQLHRPFRTALVISLLNPKAIFFFVSFFIQFVDTQYPHPSLSFLILGCVVQACSLTYLSALIFGGKLLANTFAQQARLSASGMALVGTLFIGFGVRLAAERLS